MSNTDSMIYRTYREYTASRVDLDCGELIEELIDYNQKAKYNSRNIALTDIWVREHIQGFYAKVKDEKAKLENTRLYLKSEILNKMKTLNDISTFKDDDIYQAIYDDLRDMKRDLNIIGIAFNILQNEIRNLDADDSIIERFGERMGEYHKKHYRKVDSPKSWR